MRSCRGRFFSTETKEWYHIFVNGEELVCTGGHPFFVASIDKFLPARELKKGNTLLQSDGSCSIIEKIKVEYLTKPHKTYNFEVAEYHTYYVGEQGILVHNDCGVKPTQKGIDNVKKHLNTMDDFYANDAMIGRIEKALANGQKIYGADKNFYMHELKEMMLMKGGMPYSKAHEAALSFYNVSR